MFPINLNRSEKAFIKIPRDIIRYDDDKLVLTFIYFAVRKGLDDRICFTINSLVDWCGYVPNYRENRTNDNFINAIVILNNLGYVSVDISKLSRKGNELVTAIFECEYLDDNIEKLKASECDGLFAILYIDEIEKILSYEFKCKSDKKCSVASLIKTFAYLRSMIYLNGSTSPDCQPEAYYEYYFTVAENIHMTSKTFSKLVSILCDELSLIYYRHIRKKTDLTKTGWITLPTVFTNAYCRHNGKLWNGGQDYCLGEVRKKMKLMGENFAYNTLYEKKDTLCEEKESNEKDNWIEML